MTLTEYSLAAAALLLTPGPTNTLVAVAGAERGWQRALRLIPAEIAGYLLAVVPLWLAGAALVTRSPAFGVALTAVAAIWVMMLAFRMWRVPGALHGPRQGGSVDGFRIALTTFLNPKALVVGLVLLPHVAQPVTALGIFVVFTALAAALWAGLGAGAFRRAARAATTLLVYRAAAVWLAFLSTGLAWRALSV